MQKQQPLILDTFCEVYDLLKPWADGEFWDFKSHQIVPGATYLIGRRQFTENVSHIRELVEKNIANIILSNPAEGSDTLIGQCKHLGITDLVKAKKILLIGGGNMDESWPCLQYDSFLPKVLDYKENIDVIARVQLFEKINKPYKFLFLNGRMRPHRKYLLESLQLQGLLDCAIWTILDNRDGASRQLQLWHNGVDLMREVRPPHYLDPCYEVEQYHEHIGKDVLDTFKKHTLFNNTWGEIYLKAEPYEDTYFSLVTETVFDYPYSFHTEKIWKPIAIGHPWIAVSNAGYYRDMHNNGYNTFGHLIDEKFDQIENNQARLDRIIAVVKDLCSQDLPGFLAAAQDTCKYNQQRYKEHRVEARREFPNRFFQFINKHYG